MWLKWSKIYRQHELDPNRLVRGDLKNDMELVNNAIVVGLLIGAPVGIYLLVHTPASHVIQNFLAMF